MPTRDCALNFIFNFKMTEISQMGGSIREWEEYSLDLGDSSLEYHHGIVPCTTTPQLLYNNQLDRRYVIWNIRLDLYYLDLDLDDLDIGDLDIDGLGIDDLDNLDDLADFYNLDLDLECLTPRTTTITTIQQSTR